MAQSGPRLDTDVVVIGAGVMGAATAYELSVRGVSTLVFEQFGLHHTRGSSHGPTRIYRLADPKVRYVALAQVAAASWRRLEADAGVGLIERTGGVDVGPHAEACAAALTTAGVKYEWLAADAAMGRFPGIAFTPADRILYHDDAGVILAERAHRVLLDIAQRRGVTVTENTAVLGWHEEGDRVVVETAAESVRCRVVVATAGPWSPAILSEVVGRRPLMTPSLAQYSYFAERDSPPHMPTFIETGLYRDDAYLVPAAGGAPGHKVGIADAPRIDPDAGRFTADEARTEQVIRYAERRFPGLRGEPLSSETCLYTMTPDQDFILDRVGKTIIGAGFSGHGFKFGPLVGRILASLAVESDPGVSLSDFRADRSALTA